MKSFAKLYQQLNGDFVHPNQLAKVDFIGNPVFAMASFDGEWRLTSVSYCDPLGDWQTFRLPHDISQVEAYENASVSIRMHSEALGSAFRGFRRFREVLECFVSNLPLADRGRFAGSLRKVNSFETEVRRAVTVWWERQPSEEEPSSVRGS